MKDEHLKQADGYERRDALTRPLLLFGAALAGLIAVSLLVGVWLDAGFTPRREGPSPTTTSYDAREAQLDPSWPVLQANPYDDYDAHRAHVEEILGSYAWIDRQTGIARIPIDRALTLYLESESATQERGR